MTVFKRTTRNAPIRGFVALIGVLGSLAGCGFLPGRTPVDRIEGSSFAITNVRVFDGEELTPSATVVVIDGTVASVGNAAPPRGTPIIKGDGKTLLPGLIDAHVHSFDEAGLESAMTFGVTTELDQFTAVAFLETRKPLREMNGRTRAADLFSAGTIVTSAGGHGTQFGLPIPTISTPEEAPAFVRARLAEGSDWIKIAYEPDNLSVTSISRETLFALVAAAKAEDAIAVVHISTLGAARDAIAAGADGLVHVFADAPVDEALIAAMQANGVFVIPTLEIIAAINDAGSGPALMADQRLAPYILDAQSASLLASFNIPAGSPILARFNLATARANVRALHAAGIPILAGTDAPNPGAAYGVSMHGEMRQLVDAGLTPSAALAAASGNPAKAFRIADRGRIAVGQRADLVLVDGDPTTDIDATRAIVRLFKNGYEVERKTAAELKRASPRPNLTAGLVSDFEEGLGSAFGVDWFATTDQIANGASTATLARVSPGANGSQGALRIDGEISTKFLFPWSGGGVFFSNDGSASFDLSGYSKISFVARGAPRDYALMFATRSSAQRPATYPVPLTEDWGRVAIDLASIRGAAMDEVYWVALTAGRPQGPFWIEIDDVRLE